MRNSKFLLALCLLNLLGTVALFVSREEVQAEEKGEVLRAGLIELVDATGQVRAQFKVEDSGEAVFRMRDTKGQVRVKIGADDGGSGLVLMDEHTEPAVQILTKDTSINLKGPRGSRVIQPE